MVEGGSSGPKVIYAHATSEKRFFGLDNTELEQQEPTRSTALPRRGVAKNMLELLSRYVQYGTDWDRTATTLAAVKLRARANAPLMAIHEVDYVTAMIPLRDRGVP